MVLFLFSYLAVAPTLERDVHFDMVPAISSGR